MTRPRHDGRQANRSAGDRRREDMEMAVRAAKILGCDKIRVFTGSRVADPQSLLPRIAEELNSLLPLAEKEKGSPVGGERKFSKHWDFG